jgi:hypothetical protein
MVSCAPHPFSRWREKVAAPVAPALTQVGLTRSPTLYARNADSIDGVLKVLTAGKPAA